jgi:hypothetical protein
MPSVLWGHRRMLRGIIMAGSLAIVGACHDLTGSQPLPSGTSDPASYRTAAGAIGMRNQGLYTLVQSLPDVVTGGGLLTDELESNFVGASQAILSGNSLPLSGSLDERVLPELPRGSSDEYDPYTMYRDLQSTRGAIIQALGALAAYDTGAATIGNPPVLRGELFALSGYAEILLADLYCSGVPLSTVDFERDFTYKPGSTTAQIYQDVIIKEDSALALVTGSDTVLNLARVLKGRALLALGQYAAAADDVSTVPDAFQYHLTLSWKNVGTSLNFLNHVATVSDREGRNGLPYRSSGDPRTAVTLVPNTEANDYAPLYFPNKYAAALTGAQVAPFVVASGVEARLIQAEAVLRAGNGSWLTMLNTLRTTCTDATSCATPAPAGTGGVAGLPPLSDPGQSANDTARVNLLFRERAAWLFLDGHRQGDLRRLIRQYGQSQNHLYPVGPYTAPGVGQYGTDVTVPVPSQEYTNPYFQGCVDRNA